MLTLSNIASVNLRNINSPKHTNSHKSSDPQGNPPGRLCNLSTKFVQAQKFRDDAVKFVSKLQEDRIKVE